MHILHALEQVMKRIEVCTINTDVIVILVGAFVKLTRGQPLGDINFWSPLEKIKDLRF